MELSKVQQEAADFYKGCCNVIAAAGSGKTATLVTRIVNLIEDHDVDPANILAITFSKKAKENMMRRLSKLIPEYAKYINIETFHSFGYKIVRKFSSEDYEILDADWKKVKIVEEIMQRLFRIREPDGKEIADALSYISIQKNKLKEPNEKEKFGKVYKRYEAYKEKHHQIDFDDMLVKCYEILSTNDKALEYCQNKYQFILADEMQDTNTAQYEIIRLIGDKHKNVFVVGDGLQAIYQWRGSDNRYIMNFDEDWPNTRIIHLNKNYRSSKNIIDLANHFAKCIPESLHRHYVESVPDKAEFEQPHYTRYSDEICEAKEIAKKIESYINAGYSYKDIAVLTRTNAQLQNFETALYRSDIPYTIVDGMSFVDRKEIKIVLCYLRLICDIDDDEAFEYIYNRPNRWLGQSFIQEVRKVARRDKLSLYRAMFRLGRTNARFKNAANSINSVITEVDESSHKNVSEMIHDLRDYLNLDSYVSKDLCDNDDSRTDNLDTLERMASNYKDVKKFISFIIKFSKEKKNNPNSVQLMTIHKSKGLEFPIVFVAGVNHGLLPHEKNTNIDEEKRLMYVAITRAEKILNISSTEYYNRKEAMESEFIKFIF